MFKADPATRKPDPLVTARDTDCVNIRADMPRWGNDSFLWMSEGNQAEPTPRLRSFGASDSTELALLDQGFRGIVSHRPRAERVEDYNLFRPAVPGKSAEQLPFANVLVLMQDEVFAAGWLPLT